MPGPQRLFILFFFGVLSDCCGHDVFQHGHAIGSEFLKKCRPHCMRQEQHEIKANSPTSHGGEWDTDYITVRLHYHVLEY